MKGQHTTSVNIPVDLYEKAKGRITFKEALIYGINAMLGDLDEHQQAIQLKHEREKSRDKIEEQEKNIEVIEDKARRILGMDLDDYLEEYEPKNPYQSKLEKFVKETWKPFDINETNMITGMGFDLLDPVDVAEVYEDHIQKEYGISSRNEQIKFCTEAYDYFKGEFE